MVLNGIEKNSREEGDGLQSRERSIFNKIVSQSLLERDGKEAAWLEGIQWGGWIENEVRKGMEIK